MLITLESSALAIWVGESLYAYPGLLACHIIGLAIVVGVFAMRDLRLLGLVPEINLAVFSELKTLAYAGFVINLVSGLLLFSSQASYLATSIPFLTKISCVTAGMIVAAVLNRKLEQTPATENQVLTLESSVRWLAVFSLIIWSSAIIAGRLIAYVY